MACRGWAKGEIHQGLLEQTVRSLFVGEDVAKNVRKNALIKNPETGKYLELDILLPRLHICFEFQDSYHYIPSWYYHAPLDVIQQNDFSKREATLQKGNTLIVIPCWWDGNKESLVATIHTQRTDLLTEFNSTSFLPIPLNPPKFFFKGGKIPGVGELMLASFPLPEQFGANFFDSFWWMGEKYDGVRFCWSPQQKVVYSRSGYIIQLPKSLRAIFPKKYMDGEIWFGRGTFQDSQSIVTSDETQINWSLLRFISFDEPFYGSQDLPFETRYSSLLTSVLPDNSTIIVPPRVKCVSQKQMIKKLEKIILDGGEGVVLRKPKSFYEQGRSTSLFKIKATRGDREALVVTSNPSSTVLQLPNGTEFTLPTPTETQLKRGEIVTFTFTSFSFSAKSLPMHARVLRVRRDIAWEDVLRERAEQPAHELSLNETSRNIVRNTSTSNEKLKKMRSILEAYAKKKNFEPLVAENWYSFRKKTLSGIKGGNGILKHFRNSHVKALVELFPEIRFEKNKFAGIPRHYWADLKNRKKFLMDVAKHEKFDPKVAENWYKVTLNQFLSHKGGVAFLSQYDGDYTKSLIHLFPDIHFDSKRFKNAPRKYWKISERKKLFEDFARNKGFNPKILSNWYTVRKQEIKQYKDMNVLLAHYNESVSDALLHLFPNLEKEKLMLSEKAYWKDKENQKSVFLEIAKEKGFEALVPDNWYSIKYDTVMATQGGPSVLAHYKGNYREALISVFPNIGLTQEKFSTPRGYWQDSENQQKFFFDFATTNDFDPLFPANWYSISNSEISKAKGGKAILSHFNNSLPRALQMLLPSVRFDVEKFA